MKVCFFQAKTCSQTVLNNQFYLLFYRAGVDTMADLPTKAMANAIRVLSMDAVEAAKSGHPGTVSYTHLRAHET